MTPKSQQRLFEKKYAVELIKIADGDYRTANALINVPDIRIENAFYLAQQSIEKAIKAVLVFKGIAVPLVHDLGAVLSKLPETVQPPYGYELIELNQYAAIRRYEEGSWTPSQDELKDVVQKAKKILEWAYNIVGKEKKV